MHRVSLKKRHQTARWMNMMNEWMDGICGNFFSLMSMNKFIGSKGINPANLALCLLGGDFKQFLCSSLFGEMIQFD